MTLRFLSLAVAYWAAGVAAHGGHENVPDDKAISDDPIVSSVLFRDRARGGVLIVPRTRRCGRI